MISTETLLISLGSLALLAPFGAEKRPPTDARHEKRIQAAGILKSALDAPSASERRSDALVERYTAASRRAVALLGAKSHVAKTLSAAMAQITSEADLAAEEKESALRAFVQQTYETLVFKPIIEAELPRGFPGPTPVGEIELKRYPAYRMALADSRGGSAFWTLFRHIKTEGIAMTAPVQMDYQASASQDPAQRSMAFLYGSPDFGEPVAAGPVRVVDVPPGTVIGIGLRGVRTPQKVTEARDQLLGWLSANSERYARSGELRVMGYNSPFVPAARRYFEVQIPVKNNSRQPEQRVGKDPSKTQAGPST